MKKKINTILLSVIILLMSALGAFTVEASGEWDDDWTNAPASAFGSAGCTEGGADAEASCYPTGSVIGLSSYVSGNFTYMNDSTGVFMTVSDYDTDSGNSNAYASVEFTTPTGCIGVHIEYSYTASYSAYYHGTVYGNLCSGSDVWAAH